MLSHGTEKTRVGLVGFHFRLKDRKSRPDSDLRIWDIEREGRDELRLFERKRRRRKEGKLTEPSSRET